MRYGARLIQPTKRLHRLRAWAQNHPWTAKVLLVIGTVYAVGWMLTPAANAAGGGEETPSAPGDTLLSSDGVRASHYGELFIDRGWFMEGDKKMLAWVMDMLWSIHFTSITTAIDLIGWVLRFEWVDVLAVPLRNIANIVQVLIERFGIIPLALTTMGFVVALYIFRGKFAKGAVEYITSSLLAVLAAGILANPVAWMTEADGPIDKSRDFGANLSAAITSGDGHLEDLEASSEEVLSASVEAPLVDLFIADPAEYISFGSTLSGECRTEFIEEVTALDPLDPDSDGARKTAGSCDEVAKAYSENASWWRINSIASTMTGAGWLWLFAVLFVIIMFLSILGTLWAGFTATWRAVIAVFPLTDRSRLLVSLAMIFAGLFFIVATYVLLAGYFRMLTLMFDQMEALGLATEHFLRIMGAVGIIACVGLVLILWQFKRRAHRAAERAAKALEDVGANRSSEPIQAVPDWVKGLVSTAALSKLAKNLDRSAGESAVAPTTKTPTQQSQRGIPDPSTWQPVGYPHATSGAGAPAAGGGPAGGGSGSGARNVGHLPSYTSTGRARSAGAALRYGLAATKGWGGLAAQASQDLAFRQLGRVQIDEHGHGSVSHERPDHPSLRDRVGPPEIEQARGELGIRPSARVIQANSSGMSISVDKDGTARVVDKISPTDRD